jgi:hypothetical protein
MFTSLNDENQFRAARTLLLLRFAAPQYSFLASRQTPFQDAMNSTPEQPADSTVARQNFSALFCERFRCRPSEFEELAFRKCLHRRALLFAPIIRKVVPTYFEPDFMLIRYLGQAVGQREAMMELSAFTENSNARGGFARKDLRIRVSTRRTAKLLRELLQSR